MSELVEQLDRKTLDRLDLPKSFESQQGLDRLFLQKLLNLAYIVNDIWSMPHKVDVRAASDITAAGATFTAPVNARRLIFSMQIAVVTTATVGSRGIVIQRRDKTGTNATRLNGFINRTLTASITETYDIGPVDAGDGIVTRQITTPLVLEPEWVIIVDDTSNIDNLDGVRWNIEYLEIPI